MVIKCGYCGELMESETELEDGTPIGCPSCGKKAVYRKPQVKESTLRVIRNAREPLPSSSYPPSSVSSIAPPFRRKKKTANDGSSIRVVAIALLVVGGLSYYWWKTNRKAEVPNVVPQTKQVQSATYGDEEHEKLRRERIAREEAEREKRKAERDLRTAEREKELQAQREKAEAEKEARERFEDVEMRFKSGTLVFASDFPKEKSPLNRDGIFYAIGSSYMTEQKLYEAMVENGTLTAVRTISTQGAPEDVDVGMFSDMIKKERMLVMGGDGFVWIFGTGKASWTEKATLTKDEILPSMTELKGLHSVLASWGRIPDHKFRLTLKPVNGEKGIQIGIIDYGEAVSAWKIRDALLPMMQARKEKGTNLPKPKLKKFTPTVVLYDGSIISSGIGGVTKVPRTFKHLGTKHQGTVKTATYKQSEERWKNLKEEAERQERQKEEVLRENQRLMQEYESKIRAILNEAIRGEDIEAEAKKYVLLIERSRSRLPKP